MAKSAPVKCTPTRSPKGWRAEPSSLSALMLLLPLLTLLLAFLAYPVLQLFVIPIRAGGGGALIEFFRHSSNVRALAYTAWETAAVTAATLALGAPMAWALRTSGSGMVRSVLWTATLVPVAMNVVIRSYAFVVILSDNGVLSWLVRLVSRGTADGPDLLYTPYAVIVGMVYTMLPYAVLPLFVAFSLADIQLVKVAEVLGASRMRAVTTVALPLSMSGVVAASTIVFLYALGFYVTPVLLGGAQSPSMATLIGDDLMTRFDTVGAAAASAILVVGAALVLLGASIVFGSREIRRVLE